MQFKFRTLFFLFVACNSGCRSEADRMAEFCLGLDAVVTASQTCEALAQGVSEFLDAPQAHLKDLDLCATTTACLPCREASHRMLLRCGYDAAMAPVLSRFHFSEALRAAQRGAH